MINIKLTMRYSLILLICILISDCNKNDSPTNLENTNDPLLIGTWNLTSVNGQPIPSGVYLRWTFTESTVTITSDADCIEVIRYEAVNGELRGLELVSQEGTECGDTNTDGELGSYTVNQTTLTVIVTDPDLEPPTATFVFTKVE